MAKKVSGDAEYLSDPQKYVDSYIDAITRKNGPFKGTYAQYKKEVLKIG